MAITAEPIAVLSDNYTWLLHDDGSGKFGIVDPPVVAPVIEALRARGGVLDKIFLTHHHADHIDGAEALRAHFGAPIIGAAKDAHRLPRLDQAVVEGDAVCLGASHGRVIEVPGHTLGHIAYFFEHGPLLCCGDTLFSLGAGRFFEGTPAQMFVSLQKFSALPDATLLCCGHEYSESNARFALTLEPENSALLARAGEIKRLRAQNLPTLPALLGNERAANPFLRAKNAEQLGAVRAAKDQF
jgi:hydroxyacylglutathione hydrolase